ncbi:MAG: flagellar motor switch protein FliG [Proteobacteria bacterium]|nr:flagellar motor switch protein FliG [Pseudomonadota bacterium]MBU1388963.1 flagellar motor switch protein FliG [Pseudomonadota bacterium]MBU1543515.1 flagellar motor switch protein FliG [Pseudomonadota bacterium]MBU2429825.1 flagellar motor switch protein FliG [Pseudomonadota bacterium]MBU2480826.1 flagellar motor switch protein FliG [Pseudomonadota bacterium]
MVDVLDPKNISGPRKAAIFLMAMGEEYATRVFSKMNEQEVADVAFEMSSIDHITPEMLKAVSLDFVNSFEGESKMIIESDSFVKNIVRNTMDPKNASAILGDLEKKKQEKPFIWSRNVNVGTLAGYVEGEHPQTIAMILAHMPSEISSEILMALPEELKGDIAMRIARLGQISEDVVRDVDKALKLELSGAVGPGGKAGGLQVLVDIINGVDKSTEDAVMEYVEEDNPEMANDIRNLMFVFEDLTNIDDMAMREILKKVEGQQLTYALKTATDEMKEKIFSNLSQRAGEMLKDDLEAMGPVRLTEVEEAQQTVVRAAKELEADGTITLGKGKDDVLV